MFGWLRFFRGMPLFRLFMGMSLSIAFIVPSLCEWMQDTHSLDHLNLLGRWGVAVLLITAAVCGIVMRLRKDETGQPAASANSGHFQFGTRHVLLINGRMTVIRVYGISAAAGISS